MSGSMTAGSVMTELRPVAARPIALGTSSGQATSEARNVRLDARHLSVRYGTSLAVSDVNLSVYDRAITAIIGPSGCGKSTLLRVFNRMNDLIPGARCEGRVEMDGVDILAPDIDVVKLRRHVGMVFQKPNPSPMSIYDNVVYGPRQHGVRGKGKLDGIVEQCLTRAALWDEVKDRLSSPAMGMSGGQQQ